MTKPQISVLIHTLNEEKNIRNCLESVKWADEIIIVDMYSDDKTVDIAKEYTDKIFFHERVGYADPARKLSLEKASNQWLLTVDADELVPKKMKDKLLYIVENDLADIVSVPHNNYFFGHLMEYTGWGPLEDTHHRFIKKEFINEITGKIHGYTNEKSDARIYKIEDPEEGFVHFNYLDFEHFLDKLNKYTTIEAKSVYEDGRDIKFRSLIKMMIREFYLRYFSGKGRKEGYRGFSLSLLMVTYRLVTYSKLKLMKEYKTNNPREKIVNEYQNIADEILSQYE